MYKMESNYEADCIKKTALAFVAVRTPALSRNYYSPTSMERTQERERFFFNFFFFIFFLRTSPKCSSTTYAVTEEHVLNIFSVPSTPYDYV